MERRERKDVLNSKEKLDQEFNEIENKLKVIAETMSEFAHNLKRRPEHIVIAEDALEQTKYRDNKIYFSKNHLKQALNFELIDDYLMPLQNKSRELAVMAQELND